jgi:Domain of unknown function (DUF4465)/Secretion system C-terminal sorting domain
MRILRISFCFLSFFHAVSAQTISDFENFNLPLDTFLNNAGGAAGFLSGNISLSNTYTPQFDTWEGWAISTETDVLTPGYENQYSAFAGGGNLGSRTYATAYAYSPVIMRLEGAAAGGVVTELFVSNSAYAYWAIKDGDAFSKKFGGETGDDPDFFKLTVRKFLNGNLSQDSVEVFLADYRFADNAQDYCLLNWVPIDLSSLGAADSLSFSLSSSDNGVFGMNTPAYFCIDEVKVLDAVGVQDVAADAVFAFSPNPAATAVTINLVDVQEADVQVFDQTGRPCLEVQLSAENTDIFLNNLPAGAYWVSVRTAVGRAVRKMIKK